MADEQRKLSTLDFKHSSQHVAVAAATSKAQHETMAVAGIQAQQIVSQGHQQQVGVATAAGQVATLLSQQPQPIRTVSSGGNQLSPNGPLAGN